MLALRGSLHSHSLPVTFAPTLRVCLECITVALVIVVTIVLETIVVRYVQNVHVTAVDGRT